jgi:assimilatory nitrate reductase catalytic subunit
MAGQTRTTCPYCGVGCGVIAVRGEDGAVSVRGDPDHPANFGRLCSKGSALAETIDLDGRLLHPEVDGRLVGWDQALDHVARRFGETIAAHGPEAVAFYVSGQLLTEDYYVANKLMKGFIGTANIDTNSRLCMASSVAGHRRAFGSDTVPGIYEDLELADLVVLVGSNLAWCHPVLYQRLAAAKAARPQMTVVLVDPRRTMTADLADMHLAIRPDGDGALFAGLLAWLDREGALDRGHIERHTTGFEAALLAARRFDLPAAARAAGLTVAETEAFYRLFAETERTVTAYSQGVNQSAFGTDKVNAIINCHLATGRIGRAGTGPFSLTGQPNAMGGREVGGLANMLAAHMEIENPAHRERVRDFWRAPTIADRQGLKAVDMFRAVADGRIKALWVMATNPAVSMPEADAVAGALAACPFVVVSDVMAQTDTMRHADVKLPAAAWGEKNGTVTNSERRISRQRSFLPLPGEVRQDWWIVAQVARRMGFREAFAYDHPSEIFAEHAALSADRNDGTRDFDIGVHAGIDRDGYDALAPFQWPARAGQAADEARLFADGGFFTPDGKARFVTVDPPETAGSAASLVLNTGRVRDHWHTMTRTGKSARLSQHIAEPYCEIHPADAARAGIMAADLVALESASGRIVVRALVSDRQREGCVFVPMHWNGGFASNARVDVLVPGRVDPVSGQPALKGARVRLSRWRAALHGFAVLAERPASFADADYWALARAPGGWRLELAWAQSPADLAALAETLLGGARREHLSMLDRAGSLRSARFSGDALVGALHLGPEPVAAARAFLVARLEERHAAASDRLGVVAGRPPRDRPDKGAIVCSCFSVGLNEIAAAAGQGARDVAAVGRLTQAGTNCGSCRAEIGGILDACRHKLQAAE